MSDSVSTDTARNALKDISCTVNMTANYYLLAVKELIISQDCVQNAIMASFWKEEPAEPGPFLNSVLLLLGITTAINVTLIITEMNKVHVQYYLTTAHKHTETESVRNANQTTD